MQKGLTPAPVHYGAAAAICLDKAADLRIGARACPWSPDSRRELFEAWRRVRLVHNYLAPRAAALLPGGSRP